MIITKTPFRISFIGGGSDIIRPNMSIPGCVISTTINKYIYVFLKESFNNNYKIKYSKTEIVKNIKDINHEIIRNVLLYKKIKTKLEINIVSDIPASGSGLGSSSSLTVGLLKAIDIYLKKKTSKYDIAIQAQYIEEHLLNNKIGFQDHFNASFGGFKKYMFTKNKKINFINLSNKFKKKKLKENIIIFYSGVNRKANKILNCINYKKTNKIFDELSKLTEEFYVNLKLMNHKELGRIVKKSWELKKQTSSKVTTTKIDRTINKAFSYKFVYGGKVMGAGGGGFYIFFCNKKYHKKLEKILQLKVINFKFEENGCKSILND